MKPLLLLLFLVSLLSVVGCNDENSVTGPKGSLVRITSNTATEAQPSWSPDGKTIAFFRQNSSTAIWMIPVSGGSATQLTQSGDHPTWSRNSDFLAFESAGIWLISIDGQTLTLVTNGTEPDWAHDGDRIAFTRDGIWIFDLVTDKETQVTSNTRDHRPSWSPDGTKIAYSANGPSAEADLWVVSSTGGPVTQLTSHPAPDSNPSWSPDGTRIAFESERSGNFDIWVMPAAGGEPTQLTFDPADDTQPDWSPDGSRIVFDSARSGNFDIWMLTAP